MQIVIDIDDKVYGLLKYFEKDMGLNDKKDSSDDVKTALMRAVINGIPLPRGHGDLKDMDDIYEALEGWDDDTSWIVNAIDCQAQTIIEADGAENEEE